MEQPWYARAYDERYYTTYAQEFSDEETERDIDRVVELLDLAPGARILDLACGFGRHSLALSRRGFQVTGLDLSHDLLEHARKTAAASQLDIEWIEADMREIPAPETPYDAVISLFSSFGFFGNDAQEERVVAAVARALAAGGRFLIDTANREIFVRQWRAERWRERSDGLIIMDRLRFDVLSGILHASERIVTADGAREAGEHQLRLWTFNELAGLLTRAGFGGVCAYGALDGRAYELDSHRMVVLGLLLGDDQELDTAFDRGEWRG